MSDSDKSIDRIAQDFADTFATTWNSKDGIAYGEAYWPDAELVDPTGTIWNGREAIADMHVNLWLGPAQDTMVAASVRRVRLLGPTLAVIDLDVRVTGFSPPPPGASADANGAVQTRLKHVIEKRGAVWGIVASQNTFVVPAR
jgi:uncharacterized protein (TIGR02246 family)